MYGDTAAPLDPYSEAYTAPAPAPAEGDPPARALSRSRSPTRAPTEDRYRSPGYRTRSPPPARKTPATAPVAPNPSNVLGVFGLSIRTRERDLDEEFSRFGRVEKVTIVYDQRQSDRSRGFGFIKMATVEDATRCIHELNGVELNGRRIRVDYSVTDKPHAPTPGEYMGHRRATNGQDSYSDRRGGDRYERRGGGYDSRDRDRYDRRSGYDSRDRDRDNYGRDRDHGRDWRDRRSPPPSRGGGGRYSPEYRKRRSYSRSPPPRGASPPARSSRDYDAAPAAAATSTTEASRW